jgi:hypothetical protein
VIEDLTARGVRQLCGSSDIHRSYFNGAAGGRKHCSISADFSGRRFISNHVSSSKHLSDLPVSRIKGVSK